MLTYTLDRHGGTSLYVRLYELLRDDIASGELPAGYRLPSKRTFARHLGVSVSTVEAAYTQLVAEGYVQASPRRGFYVAELLAARPFAARPLHQRPLRAEGPARANAIGTGEAATSLAGSAAPALSPPSRPCGCAPSCEAPIDLTSGAMPDGAFPYAAWAKATRQVLAEGSERMLDAQSAVFGAPRLREAIARHLASFRGMKVDPGSIAVGAGAQVLYNLLVQLLGRTRAYAVEDPGYPRLTEIYRANDVRLLHVPIDRSGIRCELLRLMGADVAHVMPSHQFPTGVVAPVNRRYELLAWAAEREDRVVIEDDYDCEFRLAGKPIPSLYGMDATESVVYLNTFSKSLGPAFRIGYMVLPGNLAYECENRLGFYNCTVSTLEQLTLAHFIESGAYERHVNRVRADYRARRDCLIGAIAASRVAGRVSFRGVDAGLHMLMVLDDDRCDVQVANDLARHGVRVAPLSSYRAVDGEETDAPCFVVQCAALGEREVHQAVRALECVLG